MTERLEESAMERRLRRLELRKQGLQKKLGDGFDAAWAEAEGHFETSMLRWVDGVIPSPYALDEADEVRTALLARMATEPDVVNCIKLYQAIERAKQGHVDD